jgi:glycosyltransferase involved in cell wall biosynthesis
MSNRPTICLGFICKNEAHCILNLLDSVYKFIDYWVICDTGSTDRTREIITEFFNSKNIPGELYVDEFQGMGHNKTIMLEKSYGKTDYLLHIDADDKLVGDFNFTKDDEGFDCYLIGTKSSSYNWKSMSLFRNDIRWVFAGVAHTSVVCLDKTSFSTGDLSGKDFYMSFEAKGARNFDPKKFQKDAENLKKQFFDTLIDDPYGINCRSAFYTAQSYMDCQNWEESLKWSKLYLRLKGTWDEEVFESRLRIASCLSMLNYSSEKIHKEYLLAHEMYPDRAEPLHYLGDYYYNNGNYELSYNFLKSTLNKNLESIKNKYFLFINESSYSKKLYINLAKSCYKLGKLNEGLSYLNDLLNDNNFNSSTEIFNEINELKNLIEIGIKNKNYFQTSKDKLIGADIPISTIR